MSTQPEAPLKAAVSVEPDDGFRPTPQMLAAGWCAAVGKLDHASLAYVWHQMNEAAPAHPPQPEPVAWRWAPAFIADVNPGWRTDWQEMPAPVPAQRGAGQIEYACVVPYANQPAQAAVPNQQELLRATLLALLDSTWSATSSKAREARASAFGVWIETTPPALKAAALDLARSRTPGLATFEEAVVAYGMLLIHEVTP